MYNLYLATPMELPAQTQGLRFSSLNLQDLPIRAKSVGVSSVISIFETASEVLWAALTAQALGRGGSPPLPSPASPGPTRFSRSVLPLRRQRSFSPKAKDKCGVYATAL